ncbi:MAG: hypothetical protein KDA24_18245 [Deltaproteobacteria bacterium]|nr:hypothetical protein [Deltaproteobacteria bacterium]
MQPRLLRLPVWLLHEGFRLERAVARDRRWSRYAPCRAVPRLRLSGPEQRFALGLLDRRRNYWLWRCDQSAACGDFAVVDVSDARPEHRTLWLIELKERSDWRPGRGLQLRAANDACDELRAMGAIGETTRPRLREGSTTASLRALSAGIGVDPL